MSKVLITDGAQRSTLAAVRSLGKRGIDVTVAEDHLPCLAAASRYCHDSFAYASPISDPDRFLRDLTERLEGGAYDLLIPMTDVTSYIVAQNRTRLSRYTKIGMPEAFDAASDKGELIRLAQRLDIPVPKTHFPENIGDVEKLAGDLAFPVVLKPIRSRILQGAQWVSTRVEYAYSPWEMIEKCRRQQSSGALPMIQERIYGPGCGAFLLFDHGEEKVVFFHRRIREKPPSGGVSVLRESLPIDPTMREHAVKLLKALNWHGVAMVEFKKDLADDRFKLMEINARFWGSLQLAVDAGIDFPYLFYQMETGGKVDTVNDYRAGVKTRWLLGDLDHLLVRLFKSNRSLNLPKSYPGRLKTLFTFFKPGGADTKLEIFRRDDMRPAIHELKTYLTGLILRRN